jgi:hypothetical protein
VDALPALPITLREYFEQKQARLRADFPCFHEEQLRMIFPAARGTKREPASRLIRRLRRELMTLVTAWTSESHYRVHLTIENMIGRCDELDLRAARDPQENRIALVAALVMLYMGSLRSGTARLAI